MICTRELGGCVSISSDALALWFLTWRKAVRLMKFIVRSCVPALRVGTLDFAVSSYDIQTMLPVRYPHVGTSPLQVFIFSTNGFAEVDNSRLLVYSHFR